MAVPFCLNPHRLGSRQESTLVPRFLTRKDGIATHVSSQKKQPTATSYMYEVTVGFVFVLWLVASATESVFDCLTPNPTFSSTCLQLNAVLYKKPWRASCARHRQYQQKCSWMPICEEVLCLLGGSYWNIPLSFFIIHVCVNHICGALFSVLRGNHQYTAVYR